MPETATALSTIDPKWFDAIALRASHRRFDGRPIDPAALVRLEAACRAVSESSPVARAVLVNRAPDGVFTGVLGNYGAIAGAPAFVAFVGPEDSLVDIGVVGEAVILEATLAGVDTCWIAGSFDAAKTAEFVELAEGEEVRAVTPIGYRTARPSTVERMMHVAVKPRKRLELEQIAPGVGSWPAWAQQAADAVRLAPSGVNGQPWRLRMDGESLVVSSKTEGAYWTAPMDCGIAMLHAELGALHAGVSGSWERLPEPDIARFTPRERS